MDEFLCENSDSSEETANEGLPKKEAKNPDKTYTQKYRREW